MFEGTAEVTSIIPTNKMPPIDPMEKPNNENHNYPQCLLELSTTFPSDDSSFLGRINELVGSVESGTTDLLKMDAAAREIARGMINLVNLTIQQDADTVFFLDKSARPAAHFFRQVWKCCFPKRDMPEVRFVNIGKEEGIKYTSTQALSELRKVYKQSVVGKKVIIADEYVATGQTLVRAKKIFESVFPDAENLVFTGIFKDCPRWYGMKKGVGVIDNSFSVDGGSFISTTQLAMGKSESFKRFRGKNDENDESAIYIGFPGGYYEKQHKQKEVNVLRDQLAYLARYISEYVIILPPKSFRVAPAIRIKYNSVSELKDLIEQQTPVISPNEYVN